MLLTLAFFITPAFWPQKALEANIRRPWSKAWRSGGSAHLPPVWPGFKSRCRRHMWVEFVVGSLLGSEWFFSGYSSFPLSSKPTFPNSNSTRNQVDEESFCGCTTSKSLFCLFIIFYDTKQNLHKIMHPKHQSLNDFEVI